MFSSTHLAAFICAVSYLHGVLFVMALPANSPISERAPLVKQLGPNNASYTLSALSGGRFSRTYEIIGDYDPNDIEKELNPGEEARLPAIVKVVSSRNSTKNNDEINNLKKVGLMLWSGLDAATNRFTMIVMRDVRKDYPVQGYSMKLLHQWYQMDKSMDILNALETSRNTVHRTLTNLAAEETIYLMHYDSHMGNFFLTGNFLQGMSVDWAPPDDEAQLSGVIAVDPRNDQNDIAYFSQWLDTNLMFSFSLQALADQLRPLGDQLSPEHAALLPEENRKLDNERARIQAEQNRQGAS